MRKFALLVLVCLIGLGLFAQQPTDQALPADAPSREQVLKFFDLIQVKKLTLTTMEAVRQQAEAMGKQIFHDAMPDPTPEQQKFMDDVMSSTITEVMGSFPIDEMLDTMVPVYQHHLSKSDLEAVIAFYSSPVGQKLLREQPQMIQESMQAMAPIQQRMIKDMLDKVQARIMNSIEEQQKKEKQKATSGKS